MSDGLAGKVSIVTGAAQGLGFAIAEAFVAEGAQVVIADMDGEAGASAATQLGAAARSIQTDVSDIDSVQAAVDFAVAELGGLDVMVNNAGIAGMGRRFIGDDLRDFDKVMAVDLFGVIAGTQRAARAMGPGGSIVNVTSIAGLTPGAGFAPYRAAKAAVVHFTKCAAIEVAELGIRVNALAPANVPTDINAAFNTEVIIKHIQPLQRVATKEDVANAAVFLASDRAAQITGIILPVDGGTTAGPPPLDFAAVLSKAHAERAAPESG